MIPGRLRRPDDGDLFGESGYRFWILQRAGTPILAVEQHEGLAWTPHHEQPIDVMGVYRSAGRQVLAVAAELLGRGRL